MEEESVLRVSGGAYRGVVFTLLPAAVAHWLFPAFLGVVSYHWLRDVGIVSSLYPMFSLAVGLFVGYRLPRYGWALAALPVVVVCVLDASIQPAASRHITLGYYLPMGLLGNVIGGFVGSHLERRA